MQKQRLIGADCALGGAPGHDQIKEQHNAHSHSDVRDTRIEEGQAAMVPWDRPAHQSQLRHHHPSASHRHLLS